MGTLRWRLILSHITPVLLLVAVLGVLLVYVLESQVILVNLSTQLNRQAALLAETASDQPQMWVDEDQAQAFVDRFGPRMTAQLMLLDPAGRILASSDPADAGLVGQVLVHPGIDQVLAGQDSIRTAYSQNLRANIADIMTPVLGPDGQVVGMVRVTHQLANVVERFQRLRSLIIQVLALGLGLGGLAAMFLAWSLERPVERLTKAIQDLADGDELAKVPESGPKELRQLAAAFNTLVDQLDSLRLARRQLLANLVHELGRPLGALRAASQALLAGADQEPELGRQLVKGMDAELKSLQRLLDDLVNYYDRVHGPLALNRQGIRPAEWLAALLAPWSESGRARGQAFVMQVQPDLPAIIIDPDRLGQAIGNLISNALKFTPAGGQITVSAGEDSQGVWIDVADTGPGIAIEDQAHLFEPFFRGQKGQRLPEGMGLGLTIARDLVNAHGGRLELSSEPGRGSRFTIHLPLNGPQAAPPAQSSDE